VSLWKRARAVAKKELTDHTRDKRSMSSALLFPLFGPLVFAVMFTLMASWMTKDKVIELPVIGAENAPGLVAFLQRYGVKTKDAPPDYEAKVQEGALDAVLIVPEGYGKRFSSAMPAEVKLVVDSSRTSAHAGQQRVRRLIEGYGSLIGSQRLIARGVTPEIAAPVIVEDKDLATPEKQAAMLLSSIPLFLVMAAFMGGMNVAIDVTAGERERGSLEPLLLNPVSRLGVVLGKWFATIVAALAATLVATLAFYVLIHRVPLQDLGVKAKLDAPEVVGILLAVVPLAPLACALQMLVATYARSFKEAQTYLQLFMMLPMIPAMILGLNPVKTKLWMLTVPILGQDILLGEVLRGENVPALWYALSGASALAIGALIIGATTRLFGQERIVFGR
jgi:sodium transport system permease protein